VLPTFPYFTAFSCVPLVWAVLTEGALRKTGQLQQIYKAVGVVNVILYIVFIIIVVVFNETKEITSVKCFSQEETTQLTNGQIAISIAYSVIISAISLIIAGAFIIFGRRVAVIAQSSNIASKTYRIAVVCALGFMLNCLFILIITGARLNNIGFSFAGLIVSEIIPSISMLFSFGAINTLKQIILGKSSHTTSGTASTTQSGTSSNSNTLSVGSHTDSSS